MNDIGFVYAAMCLEIMNSNTKKPLVKIGFTKKTVNERLNTLSKSTSSPGTFDEIISEQTHEPRILERLLHEYYTAERYNTRKEFFSLKPSDVKSTFPIFNKYINDNSFATIESGKILDGRLWHFSSTAKYNFSMSSFMPEGLEPEKWRNFNK